MKVKNSDLENEFYRFIKILLIVVILIFGVYLFTKSLVKKSNESQEQENIVEISDKNIIVGSLLNRPYTDYYVLAYKKQDSEAIVYESIINTYESLDKSLNVYVIDLDNELNKGFYAEKGNNKASSIDELKISSPTLFKISNKKIVKYIEKKDDIKRELGL